MYSGKNYKLEIISNSEAEKIKVKMIRGKFVVETATEDVYEVRTAIIEWYKEKVKAKIKERFKEYANVFSVIPGEIVLTDDSNILFKANTNQITADAKVGILPGDVIDYVLVSALCRLNNENQEEEMKQLEEILPNYEKSKEWLEQNKSQLIL